MDDEARGLAATDEYYSLRQVLASAGATLELRTSLEPLPPAGATLLLDSTLWDIFPERDARLKAWVENGGHLVLTGRQMRHGSDLRWIPLSFAVPPKHRASAPAGDSDADAQAPEPAASAPDDDSDDDEQAPATRKKPPAVERPEDARSACSTPSTRGAIAPISRKPQPPPSPRSNRIASTAAAPSRPSARCTR